MKLNLIRALRSLSNALGSERFKSILPEAINIAGRVNAWFQNVDSIMSFPIFPKALNKHVRNGTEVLRSTVGGWAWAPAVSVAKTTILGMLGNIETGTLLLVDEPGETRHVFGQKLSGTVDDQAPGDPRTRRADTTPRVEIVIKRDSFWLRLLLFADIGFSEAYMLGDFHCQDLTSFFQVSAK